jgi:D-alanyl-D-alanine carboxypeptidase
MAHPVRQSTFPLKMVKVAGGFAAIALILALLVSCAGRGQVAPTPTSVDRDEAPTPTVEAPTPAIGDPGLASTTFTPRPRRYPPAPAPAIGGPGVASSTLTAADGYIADGEGLSPFDTDYPAIGSLDSDLLDAVQRAWRDANADGVKLLVTSGWRSVRYQQALLEEAIVIYGSEAEARKWVNTPEKSTHVTGKAVDIGPTDAASWLSQHGNDYGLCQTYANEIWHYELAIEPGGTCPRPASDASAN